MKKIGLIFTALFQLFFHSCDIETKPNYQLIINGAGARWGIPGIVLCLQTNSTKETYVFNHANPVFEKVSANSYFRIGSITKNFIASLILRLDELDLLSIDQTIPIINVYNILNPDSITIKMLLCHRSGIGDYIKNPSIFQDTYFNGETGHYVTYPQRIWRFDELLSCVLNPQMSPNVLTAYSSTNYLIAGKIIDCVLLGDYYSRATPQLQFILKNEMFDRVGLSNTIYPENTADYAGLARGYEKINGLIQDVTVHHPSISNAGGAIICTATDLSEYIYSLFNNRIINSTSLAKMTTDYGGGCGLGLMLDNSTTLGEIYWHGGELPGYYSIFKYYKGIDTSLVLLMNTATGPSANNAQREILSAIEAKLR